MFDLFLLVIRVFAVYTFALIDFFYCKCPVSLHDVALHPSDDPCQVKINFTGSEPSAYINLAGSKYFLRAKLPLQIYLYIRPSVRYNRLLAERPYLLGTLFCIGFLKKYA